MMPVALTVEMDRESERALFNQIERAQRELGKSLTPSIQWAARLLCRSLSGHTKRAKQKLRKVVQNPDQRWKTDKRRAPFGVMGYKDGREKFIPIYRTGEYGKLRFYDKKTLSWYDRTEKKWKRIKSGPDVANPGMIIPGIMASPKRRVPYRGLAKKVWQRASSFIGRGGTARAMGVSNVATVWIDRDKDNPSVTITNKLRYAIDAFEGGSSAVSEAMAAAGRRMEHLIDKKIEKKMGAK